MLRLEVAGATASIDAAHGGRLASLRVGGRELILGPSGPEDASIRWGCYLMAPWPGRLAGGRLRWGGRTIQLPRTHGQNAIHGLVWGRAWTVEAATPTRATVSCALPVAEWPMGGVVRQTFTLAARELTMDASIEAGAAMPAALGWHPWFARDGEPVRLQVNADQVLERRRMLPTGRVLPVSGSRDLRQGPVLGRRRLDDAYVGARSPAVIGWPGLRLTLAFEPSPSSLVVYTPAHAVCVEPQTAQPNALALSPGAAQAAGASFLGPGATMSGRLVLSWAVGDPTPGSERTDERDPG